MSRDRVLYLNRDSRGPLSSKLRQMLHETKQARASAAQWGAIIAAFTQRGVKKLEIDESGIAPWLAAQEPTAMLSRQEVLQQLDRLTVTIKEVVLGTPRFPNHRQPGGEYAEILYIANAERDNVNEALEQVEYDMEELSFHLDRLEENPNLLCDLEARRTALIDYQPKAIEFQNHHFSSVVNGRLGRNLLAHCRVIEYADTYFIQEIQSDWAQRGRARDWNGVPKGPFVTNTEAWSGMVLRRHLQLAAQNPRMRRVAWMTESMRNGQQQAVMAERQREERAHARVAAIKAEEDRVFTAMNGASLQGEQLAELRKLARASGEAAADRAGLPHEGEGMNAFYMKMLPKLADKAVQGTGERVSIQTLDFKNGRVPVEVPTLQLTDAVRAKLMQSQPLYSRAPVLRVPRSEADPVVIDLVQRCAAMLGSPKHLRLLSRLYDTSTGKLVAGNYVNRFVQLALNSKDLDEVADHECFHFAEDQLLSGVNDGQDPPLFDGEGAVLMSGWFSRTAPAGPACS